MTEVGHSPLFRMKVLNRGCSLYTLPIQSLSLDAIPAWDWIHQPTDHQSMYQSVSFTTADLRCYYHYRYYYLVPTPPVAAIAARATPPPTQLQFLNYQLPPPLQSLLDGWTEQASLLQSQRRARERLGRVAGTTNQFKARFARQTVHTCMHVCFSHIICMCVCMHVLMNVIQALKKLAVCP